MFEADFGRGHGWHRPKCHLRRSVRPVERDEGTREAGGLPEEKTFGDFWSFKSHSPSRVAAAKSLRGQGPRVLHGEAMPSKRWIAFRQRNDISPPHPYPLPQGARGSDRRMPRHHSRPQKNRSPRAAVFLLAQPVASNRTTGLRHGASWSCRHCLPALCPSR